MTFLQLLYNDCDADGFFLMKQTRENIRVVPNLMPLKSGNLVNYEKSKNS